MPKIIIGSLILIISALIATGTTKSGGETPWKTYVSKHYNLSLRYPSNWTKVQGYKEKYGGTDGFFQLNAIDAEELTIDGAAKLEACHRLQPYGSNPTIEKMFIKGQPARLVLPSEDQPESMGHQASLVFLSPKPVVIEGESYRYIVLWSDEKHIRAIAHTIRFNAQDKKPPEKTPKA